MQNTPIGAIISVVMNPDNTPTLSSTGNASAIYQAQQLSPETGELPDVSPQQGPVNSVVSLASDTPPLPTPVSSSSGVSGAILSTNISEAEVAKRYVVEARRILKATAGNPRQKSDEISALKIKFNYGRSLGPTNKK